MPEMPPTGECASVSAYWDAINRKAEMSEPSAKNHVSESSAMWLASTVDAIRELESVMPELAARLLAVVRSTPIEEMMY